MLLKDVLKNIKVYVTQDIDEHPVFYFEYRKTHDYNLPQYFSSVQIRFSRGSRTTGSRMKTDMYPR